MDILELKNTSVQTRRGGISCHSSLAIVPLLSQNVCDRLEVTQSSLTTRTHAVWRMAEQEVGRDLIIGSPPALSPWTFHLLWWLSLYYMQPNTFLTDTLMKKKKIKQHLNYIRQM